MAFPVTPLNADKQQLAGNMVDYWTEFAETGNPNQHGTPFWPQFNVAADDVQSLVRSTPATESTFFTDHKCAFWDAVEGKNCRKTPARAIAASAATPDKTSACSDQAGDL